MATAVLPLRAFPCEPSLPAAATLPDCCLSPRCRGRYDQCYSLTDALLQRDPYALQVRRLCLDSGWSFDRDQCCIKVGWSFDRDRCFIKVGWSFDRAASRCSPGPRRAPGQALPLHLGAALQLGKKNDLFIRGHRLVEEYPQQVKRVYECVLR